MKLPLKPGVSTTEFWATIISGILLTALSAMSLLDAAWVATAVIILTLAYTSTRGRIKAIQAQAEADELKLRVTGIGRVPPDAMQ